MAGLKLVVVIAFVGWSSAVFFCFDKGKQRWASDDEATALLKPDALDSSVHLVGDSQIGIFMQSHAGVHAHLVRELGQSEHHLGIAGNAYNAAMDAWLRSEGIDHAKTVVWMVAEAYLDRPGWIDPARHPRFVAAGDDASGAPEN
jgi:hypothetical protein